MMKLELLGGPPQPRVFDRLVVSRFEPCQLKQMFARSVHLDDGEFSVRSYRRANTRSLAQLEVSIQGLYEKIISCSYNGYIYGATFGLSPHLDVPIRYTNDTPKYTAPATVYTTAQTMGKDPHINLQYNLIWIFTVDSGFWYLATLHFCEFQLEVTTENDRIFSVHMNNQTADQEVDVIHLSGGHRIPIFKDYVLSVPAVDGLQSKVDLWLTMHPNMHSKPSYANAILNDLEIFKLNQSDDSLAGPNPVYDMVPAPPTPYPKLPGKQNSKTLSSLVVAVAEGVIGGLFLILVIGFLIFRQRMRVRDSDASVVKSSWIQFSISHTSKSTKTNASTLPSILYQQFSLAELKSATLDFKKDFVIGTRGFGYVYKGYIDNDTSIIAIKRLQPSSSQGAREFRTEIEMLSKLRHRHLVALIGYCDDNGEMILVYDYMANGTLRDHLYNQTIRLSCGSNTSRSSSMLHMGSITSI
ncbi:hypothetical protein HYC85_002657 [Camellia sinensis]|uniref:Protein kinase domain-containing protein n=1 Tax=Camellia sinensis TaxID=4442 RepID=A0A7J7IB47_CAMSI|nr:hypothetical protein HYC85_002657 [Camellia sinensis]